VGRVKSTPKVIRARPRDAERTRGRILSAAAREFANKGFDGARVDVIARRSGANKQLIYRYFGDKRGLFDAAVRDMLAVKARTHEAAPTDLEDLLPYYFHATGEDRDWLRFLLWEALSYGARADLPGEVDRCAGMQRGIQRVRDAQRAGHLPAGVPPEHALLAMMALATFPWAFPQLTRMVSGTPPSDPRFRTEYAAVLRAIARAFALAGSAAAAESSPRAARAGLGR